MTQQIEEINEIGGAKLLEYVVLDESVVTTGNTKHIIHGHERSDFHGLAICQYAGEEGYYLFYCDEHWAEITDGFHDTIQLAKDQAAFEYNGLEIFKRFIPMVPTQ